MPPIKTQYQGTWEEIKAHDAELTGQRVQLLVLDEYEPTPAERTARAMREAEELERDMPFNDLSGTSRNGLIKTPDFSHLPPAERFAAARRMAQELEDTMPFTDLGDTQATLREARNGGMYGLDPCD